MQRTRRQLTEKSPKTKARKRSVRQAQVKEGLEKLERVFGECMRRNFFEFQKQDLKWKQMIQLVGAVSME